MASGVYTTGAVTVAAIPNEYIITTDATATADKIFKDESAYVNGQKIFGSFTIDNEVNEQVDLISQIQSALEGKAAGGGTTLPTLTNPAYASDILSGKEAINGDGTKITGAIATKTSSNLTVSGATVTVPAGYYASQSTKSVATATQATPTVSIDANGKITASATQTAGYVSAGTKSGTKQLTTQAAKTITPSTSSQTAVAKNVYTTGAITVGAIPSNYEDVGTETSAYTAKLATLETAITALETELEGKASGGSGGGSVETCMVSISGGISPTNTDYQSGDVYYSAYENGQILSKKAESVSSGVLTINNVIKNSLLTIDNMGGYASITNNATLISKLLSYSAACFSIDGDNASIHAYSCYLKGTLIRLSNGTNKKVQDITYDDELLVWDFDKGCYTSAKPLWIKKTQKSNYYYHCVFENGITLDLVGSDGNCHAVFCVDDNRFEYANNCIGKTVMTEQGAAKLISCELKHKVVEFYNIITDYHMNCFANGVLTSTKLNNIYPIEDMKFIKDDREHIVYEAYSDIPIEFYQGLRLSERKIDDIGRLNEKVHRIIALMVPKQ